MDIVFISDENFVLPTSVAITSLIENNSQSEIVIHVICDKLSEESIIALKSMSHGRVTIDLVEPNEMLLNKITESGYCNEKNWPICDMMKFWFADIFHNIDRILYLDGDVLVNKDISELFKIDFGNNYLAAVNDMKGGIGGDKQSEYAKRIGLKCNDYFNAGVMLFNLKKMREDGIVEKLVDYRTHHEDKFMDQDTMNAVLCEHRLALPIKYNFFTVIAEDMYIDEACKHIGREYSCFEDMFEDQSILHMAGKYKPWKYLLPYISPIYQRYYDLCPVIREKRSNLISPLPDMNQKYRELDTLYANLYRKTDFLRRIKKRIIP